MKTCKKCGVEWPLERFARNPGWKDGHDSTCKDCRNKYRRHFVKRRHWRDNLKNRYGITPQEYDALWDSQCKRCAICGREPTTDGTKRRFDLDHNHETGAVRAILCHDCNMMVGFSREKPDVLRAAARYLEEH